MGGLILNWIQNTEGKITECWLVNGEYFFKFGFVKRAKLHAHNWSSGCLTTAYSIEKLFFSNNDVSFWDSWRGMYRGIKGQERKWKQEQLSGVLRERFQKVGDNKILIDWVRSDRGQIGHGARTSMDSVRTPWPRAKYFPVRPSHSVNKKTLSTEGEGNIFFAQTSKPHRSHFQANKNITISSPVSLRSTVQ